MTPNEENEAKNKLASLGPRQYEVLKLVCSRVDYATIADRLTITEKTVRAHMHQVYKKLDLGHIKSRTERVIKLREVYCPLLSAPDLPPPKPEADSSEPVPEEVIQMVDDDEKALVVWQPKQIIPAPNRAVKVIDAPYPPPINGKRSHPLRWIVIGMLLGVTLVAAIAWAIIAQINKVHQDQIALLTSQPADTATPIVLTSLVTVEVAQATPLPQTIIVTATAKPASSTPKPSQTVLPTETAVPGSATVESSASPDSTPGLLFADDFNDDRDPEWTVVSGELIVTDGRLGTVSDSVTVEIGDATWSSYTLDFDYVGYCGIYIVVAQQLRYHVCEGNWQAFRSNSWDTIANGPSPSYSGAHLRIVISGNSYTVFHNGVQFFDIDYGQPISGPLAIVIYDDDTFVDNVSITSP